MRLRRFGQRPRQLVDGVQDVVASHQSELHHAIRNGLKTLRVLLVQQFLPTWFLGWHAPRFKLTKASIIPNRYDSHALHRLVDDLFAQIKETFTSDSDGPVAFRTLLIEVADDFDRAPRGAALETLQRFGVPSGTPFWGKMRSFRVAIACTECIIKMPLLT